MKLVEILVTASTIAGAILAAPAPTDKKDKRAKKFQFVGVNESGAEFGNTALPGQLGKDYTWPDQNAINVSASLNIHRKRYFSTDMSRADYDSQGNEHIPNSHHDVCWRIPDKHLHTRSV
jgi:hypothetical protein